MYVACIAILMAFEASKQENTFVHPSICPRLCSMNSVSMSRNNGIDLDLNLNVVLVSCMCLCVHLDMYQYVRLLMHGL